MKKHLISPLLLLLCLQSYSSFSQERDSSLAIGGITGDSLYIIRENIPKNKFWGNSWYTGFAYNFSTTHEFVFNFGRTNGTSFASGGGFNMNMKSWGIGYSYFSRGHVYGNTLSGFAEISNFYYPPATARMEYIYDITNGGHYIRPSVGLNFFAIDFLYSYSFMLLGNENHFKHGLTLRFKYFLNNKNWQKVYPSHC